MKQIGILIKAKSGRKYFYPVTSPENWKLAVQLVHPDVKRVLAEPETVVEWGEADGDEWTGVEVLQGPTTEGQADVSETVPAAE